MAKVTVLNQIMSMYEASIDKARPEETRKQIHDDMLDFIQATCPSGSGIDSGTRLESISRTKLVFSLDYHHMNDTGFYDGWTHHKVVLRATLNGYDFRITGRDRNEIKDALADIYLTWLESDLNDPDSAIPSRYYLQDVYYNYQMASWVKRKKHD